MAPLNALILSLATLATALPHSSVKRQISQLRDSYDFVIVGGGTCGLTVADRLTEAFPNRTVLVIEYGQIEYAPGGFDPPQTIWGGSNPGTGGLSWSFTSLPNPEVKNKTATVLAGRVVGGSSAVNGMFLDRGSRFDHEAWSRTGSPEFDASGIRWDWDGIFPFFTQPHPFDVDDYGFTWEPSAYGGTTPIYATFPPFLWGDHPIMRAAWPEMGVSVSQECAGGDKEGLCWVPTSEHPTTARRSHAGLGHYAAVNTTRNNYDLLVRHQVTRVTYPNGLNSSGPPQVEVRSLATGRVFNVTARAEVIISAGALHTPTILQRSGIGPALFLRSAGIPVLLDLPGVGSNFQDHSGSSFSWRYSKPGNFSPMPSDMLNPDFAADAAAGFDEFPARGPYTLSMASSALYLSLPNMTSNYTLITDKIRAMAHDGSAAAYLPTDLRTSPEMVAGYKHQLLATADLLSNPKAPSIEVPWATGTAARLFLLHPLSRGTVRLNLRNPLDQPILDYRTGSNPVDFDIYVAHLRFFRQVINAPTMQRYGAVEVGPGEGVQSEEALVNYVKDQMTFSFMHPCCTAAMLPKTKGGVVGPDLKVHGARGLRVVDMSVLPLIPSAHLSATAYAVGEKAADLIIKEYSELGRGARQ